MSNWNQEMLKSKMTELAEQNHMNLKSLGEELSKQLIEKLLTNEKENENTVAKFKEVIQSSSPTM